MTYGPIQCPTCGRRGRVIESRYKVPENTRRPSSAGTVRRRRGCGTCKTQWITVEVLETSESRLPPERPDLGNLAQRIEELARAHPCWSQAHEPVRVMTGYLRALRRLEEVNRREAREKSE